MTAMSLQDSILLVDGNEDDVVLIRAAFQEAQMRRPLFVVNRADEAIDYLSGEGKYADRKTYPLPFLVLLDLQLPGKDGFKVLEWIQNHSLRRRVSVVVLTGLELDSFMQRAYDLGANSYIIKPVDFNRLVTITTRLKEYWMEINRRPME